MIICMLRVHKPSIYYLPNTKPLISLRSYLVFIFFPEKPRLELINMKKQLLICNNVSIAIKM